MLYNPPVVQRRDAAIPDSAGLSSFFEVSLAGVPARALVDTGASVSFIDTAFARRSGLAIKSSPHTPQIQLANGQQLASSGHVSAPMHLPGFTGTFHALAADLSHLPCDILLGDAWLRANKGCITFGPHGATSLAIKKGSKKIVLKPVQHATTSLETVEHQ